MRKILVWLVAVVATAALAVGLMRPIKAGILAESVFYEIAGEPFEGYFALNEGFGDNQPLVILIQDWTGIDDYEKRRAQMLAEQGYAAFAIDLYGQGVRPTAPEASREESGKLYEDRETMRQRLFAGIEQAQQMPSIDPNRVAAIGYCFGGAAVLELARAGADLDGFVSFHGGLETPEGQDYRSVQAPILILHGSDDPVAPMEQVTELANQMTAAGVDYTLEIYGGVDHAFTVWGGDRYDPQADIQSWASMLAFLQQTLR